MSTTELTSKIRQIKENEIIVKGLEVENEALKDAIKAEMTTRKVNEMSVDVFTIHWTTVESTRHGQSLISLSLHKSSVAY